MTRKHGKNAAIYLDEYNLSGYSNQWTLNFNVDTVDWTTFVDTSKEYGGGDYGCDFSWTGFFDTTDDGWDEESFKQAITERGTRYGGLAPFGTAAGSVVYEAVGHYSGLTHGADVAGAVALDGSVQGEKGGRGVSLLDASISATGTQTSQNYGAKAANKTLMVVYRIEAMDGAGDMVFAVEESSDDGSGDAFAAVGDLASGTLTATGTTVKTTTAATEAYLRVNVTTFDPTSATVYVTVVSLPPL